jgi:hypothetical protein
MVSASLVNGSSLMDNSNGKRADSGWNIYEEKREREREKGSRKT